MKQNMVKRAVSLLLAAMMALPLAACGSPAPAEPKPVPSSAEAASAAASSQEAAEDIPEEDKIAAEAESIISGYLGKTIDTYGDIKDPEQKYNLKTVRNIHMIGMVTGEYSINKTKANYGVGGTDLGIPIIMGDTAYIAFGDTFAKEGMQDNWRSNVLAYTTDSDYTDGILFDGMIMANTGAAKELLRGQKSDNIEVTKIPTGGISIGDTLYMSYMSVKHWGNPGEWDCNYGSVAKSTDQGKTWQYLNELKWPGDSEFCQMFPVIVDDMVYVAGISGGRTGVARMMRVPVNEYENFNAYEYLTAIDEDGSPVFEKSALDRAYAILPRAVGEMSIMFSEYLQEWLVTYISGPDITMRSAKNIWGPYSNPVIIAAAADYSGLYGAFMSPRYTSENGKKIAFLMSLWDPIYNSAVMECELVRNDE